MMTYEKPWAEYVKLEAERIMDQLDFGVDFSSVDEGVDDDW